MARRVDGMGFEVEFKTMEAVPGGYGGGGWRVGRRGPRAKVVEGKFGHGKEEVPEIRGESIVGGGEDGQEVVFCGLDGTFGREGTVLVRGGKGDGDVISFEEGTEGCGWLIVDVEVSDGVMV